MGYARTVTDCTGMCGPRILNDGPLGVRVVHHGWVAQSIGDGLYYFVHPTHWGDMRYVGRFVGGLRDGRWQVFNADGSIAWETTWSGGVWDGPATTRWPGGAIKEEGQYVAGAMTGTWSFWFPKGRLAASGSYETDRKVGVWSYFDEDGNAMDYADWDRKFGECDWALDDCSGMPRGQNWPLPPANCVPQADR